MTTEARESAAEAVKRGWRRALAAQPKALARAAEARRRGQARLTAVALRRQP